MEELVKLNKLLDEADTCEAEAELCDAESVFWEAEAPVFSSAAMAGASMNVLRNIVLCLYFPNTSASRRVSVRACTGADPRGSGRSPANRVTAQIDIAPFITSSKGEGIMHLVLILWTAATIFVFATSAVADAGAKVLNFASEKVLKMRTL